jgi:hypothetical protein
MPITKASSSAVAPAAKGQLVVGSATNDSGIVSVGANGTVLTADSAEATGVKWATPAAGGMTLLSTTSIGTSTTTSLTGISQDYTHLVVLVKDLFRTGSNTTVSFRYGNGSVETANYYYNGQTSSSTSGVIEYGSFSQDAIYMDIAGTNNRQQPNNFQIEFPFYSQANLTKNFNFQNVSFNGSFQGQLRNGYGAQGSFSSVINCINVIISSTPDTGGTIYLYGVK